MKRFLKQFCATISVFLCALILIVPQSAFAASTVVNRVDYLIDFFEDGGDIKLGSDFTLPGDYTITGNLKLDLNGHTLTIGNNKCLQVLAELEISDSSANKSGKIQGSFEEDFIMRVGNTATGVTGKLKINSGSIVSTGAGSRGIYLSKGEATMNGGKITASAYSFYNNGKFTMNGGEITATDNDSTALYGTANSVIAINNGKVTAKSYTIYHAGKLTLNKGEITSTVGVTIRNNANAKFEMNGGKVEHKGDDIAISFVDGASGVINGGQVLATYGSGINGGSAIVGFKNTHVTVNNGTISAYGNTICSNGSESGNSEGTNAKFTINGGTITSTHGDALYIPQINGLTTINGGTITGLTGIEIRAGKLVVNGGKIVATSPDYEVVLNSNGTTTKGAAISVAQHNTKRPIEVIINGGEMYGKMPFSYTNPQNNSQSDLDKISINIDGGVFNTTNGGNASVTSLSRGIISGGAFDFPVTQYLAADHVEIGNYTHNNKNMILVSADYTITLTNGSDEYVSVSKTHGYYGDVITLTYGEAPEGYYIKVDVRDKNGKSVPVRNNKFTMPNSNVTIKATLEDVTVPLVPDSGLISDNEITTTISPIIGIVFGALAGLFASRKKIKALFAK